jgi:uncharacterized protein GlcG (DUF336 family)
MTALSTHAASTIVATALAEGAARGLKPLCVVVLDPGAHPLLLWRDERASIGRPEIATAKAAGCLAMGFGGREVAERAAKTPAFYAALNQILPKGLLPVPGGVLVKSPDGALLGAVGISGDTSDNDEACAIAGITAAGLIPELGPA